MEHRGIIERNNKYLRSKRGTHLPPLVKLRPPHQRSPSTLKRPPSAEVPFSRRYSLTCCMQTPRQRLHVTIRLPTCTVRTFLLSRELIPEPSPLPSSFEYKPRSDPKSKPVRKEGGEDNILRLAWAGRPTLTIPTRRPTRLHPLGYSLTCIEGGKGEGADLPRPTQTLLGQDGLHAFVKSPLIEANSSSPLHTSGFFKGPMGCLPRCSTTVPTGPRRTPSPRAEELRPLSSRIDPLRACAYQRSSSEHHTSPSSSKPVRIIIAGRTGKFVTARIFIGRLRHAARVAVHDVSALGHRTCMATILL